ncbi:imelysin family protein [Neptuniibacter sp.]|uniref:imelysin family protein n=1 Tax=Neptuniibacter sp. TaxID=1962643 RepID=UPI00260F4245|nr:imelysin family protein [Neptuniibacter sp.]MCP4597983.1 imelysin family protein [Neptuniibacter sp.]
MRLVTRFQLILLSLTTTTVTGNTYASVTEQQWMELNQNLVQQHVLPRYQALMHTSAQLHKEVELFCDKPEEKTLGSAQSAFRDTLNAWQAIQHVQFGPIEFLMRSYSLQFWPDKKNLTSKQLNKLLKAEDPQTLQPEYFQTASIAVKGLPAIERLLFSKAPLTEIQEAPFRCQFLHAVSGNVNKTATDTFNEWQTFSEEFNYLNSEEGHYETSQEATIDLMKAQVEPLEVIRDLKLNRPLGKTKAKGKRLESWRSGQSLQNIQTNLQSLQHMFSGVSGLNLKRLLEENGVTDRAEAIETSFNSINKLLAELPSPLYLHVQDEKVRVKLLQVSAELTELHEHLGKSMNKLELQLGFNSRDGD